MDKYTHRAIDINVESNAIEAVFDGNVTAKIERMEENVLRVAVLRGGTKLKTYAVCPSGEMPREGRDRLSSDGFSAPPFEKVVRGEDCLSLTMSYLTVRINTAHFSVSVEKCGKEVYSDRKTECYNFYGELGDKLCHYIARNPLEKNFGLGDKGGDVDKTGRRFRICCLDAMGYNGKTTDVLYHHAPFYITETPDFSYGIFYDTHADSVIDLGNELDNYHGPYKYFSTDDDALVYYLIFGDVRKIVSTISRITGGSRLMPQFSFDYSGSTMAFTDADNSEELFREFLSDCKTKGFSCRSFYLSSGYTSIGKNRCVFTWNKEKFPDIKALTKLYNENGIYFIANIKPCFLTSHPLYDDMAKRGYFLHYKDGSPALCRFWDGLGSYIDFTNPEAFDFWTRKVKEELVDKGIYFTWNDNNEYEVWDKDVYCHGFGEELPAYLMKPAFSYLMLMSSQEAQKENGQKAQFMSVRSSGLGASRYAATWSGDNNTSFATLRDNHKMAMGMSLSGIFNFGHDIGGFSGDAPSRELLLRWLQNGVFTPRFTVHSWNKDNTATLPWMYEDITGSVREIFKERYSLLPYIYSLAAKSSESFVPIIAPMFYYFEDEEISVESDDFMLGESVLAVNIFDENVTEREVYLPRGDGWYFGNDYYFGGETLSVKNLPTEKAAYFVKAGSVLPLNNTDDYSFEKKPFEVTFNVFAKDEGEFYFDYYEEKDGSSQKFEISVSCEKNEVKVKADGALNVKAKLIDRLSRKLVVIKN